MRAVRTDRKLELKQELIRRRAVAVVRPAVLSTHLAELARPIRQDSRSACVDNRRILRAVRAVVPSAEEPPARKLVIPRHVVPHALLFAAELIAIAPDDFAASDELVINGPRQRTPAQRGI